MIAFLIAALICGTVIYITERIISVITKPTPLPPPTTDTTPRPTDQPDQPKPSEREAREALFQDVAATVSTLLRGEVDFDELRS